MLKLVAEYQACQYEVVAHLPLSELLYMTPSDITPEMYPTSQSFENQNCKNQQDPLHDMDNTLQRSTESFFDRGPGCENQSSI